VSYEVNRKPKDEATRLREAREYARSEAFQQEIDYRRDRRNERITLSLVGIAVGIAAVILETLS
jgi:hypothetical protein